MSAGARQRAQAEKAGKAISPEMLAQMQQKFISLQTRLDVCANQLQMRDHQIMALSEAMGGVLVPCRSIRREIEDLGAPGLLRRLGIFLRILSPDTMEKILERGLARVFRMFPTLAAFLDQMLDQASQLVMKGEEAGPVDTTPDATPDALPKETPPGEDPDGYETSIGSSPEVPPEQVTPKGAAATEGAPTEI